MLDNSLGIGCLIGKEPELDLLEQFVGSGGVAPVLVFTGGLGAGKTALWKPA